MNRIMPLTGSLPTVASRSPKTPIMSPLIWFPCESVAMQARPRQIRAQISNGPP